MVKQVKYGLDFLRNNSWQPISRNREGALKYAEKTMPTELQRLNFVAVVCDCGEYYRINYAHK